MGFNYASAGHASLAAFIEAMRRSEWDHLLAFIAVIRAMKLVTPLRNHNWPVFARAFNGPKYRENRYDEKLDHAFDKHRG